jgi:toxin-antitoxin system PIN domain toxin
MSATVDANVLIYASNTADPLYEPAVELVRRLADGPELVYLFWPTLMAYLRIVTHPAILPRPLGPRDAMRNVEALLDRPHVRAPGEADGFWPIFRAAAGDRLRGNEVPDAHLVALMRQHGVRLVYSRDRDFRRFDGIDARDPFA